MAMSQSTLALLLQNPPQGAEADAIVDIAGAYAEFAEDATALTPILAAGIALGLAAMAPALVGMSDPGKGSEKFTDGIQAFWGAVAGGLTTSFVGATAITPPPHAGLKALLDSAFVTNVSNKASLEDATDLIATHMHAQAIIGGTVTTAGPTVTPII